MTKKHADLSQKIKTSIFILMVCSDAKGFLEPEKLLLFLFGLWLRGHGLLLKKLAEVLFETK